MVMKVVITMLAFSLAIGYATAAFPDEVRSLPGFDGNLSSWTNISAGWVSVCIDALIKL